MTPELPNTRIDSIFLEIEPSQSHLAFSLGGSPFHAVELPGYLQPQDLGAASNGPCSLVRPRGNRVTHEWLQETVKNWETKDDVFERAFLKYILISQSSERLQPVIDADAMDLLDEWNARTYFALGTPVGLPEGPYYLYQSTLYSVLKVFPDCQEAFTAATLPQGHLSKRYRPFPRSDGHRLVVGVPSRLYSLPRKNKPLNGLRISVKDNIDLAGIKTTLSSRAWEDLYPAVDKTARSLEEILKLGAVVIGKTKLSQFAEVERPTADWIDFHCPFNPRGDGYLNPEGSTSGGAVALASYDWLDVSIGTDTGGSLREPASKHGLFAIRPTWGRLSMDGIFPLAHALDTVGFLARDVDKLYRVASSCLGTKAWGRRGPSVKSIITIDEFTYHSNPAKEVLEKFISDLELFVGSKAVNISLERTWMKDKPAHSKRSMEQYIGSKQTMKTLKGFDLWKNTAKFRNDYTAKFDREPYVSPMVRDSWNDAQNVTKGNAERALHRKNVFKRWYLKSILGYDEEKNSIDTATPSTITVVPISDANPEYRDIYRSGPWQGGSGFHRNFISVLTGCPEVVVPIGQIPYQSRVSKREEFLPVVVAILGAPGTDTALIKFVADALRNARRPTCVMTGPEAFCQVKTRRLVDT